MPTKAQYDRWIERSYATPITNEAQLRGLPVGLTNDLKRLARHTTGSNHYIPAYYLNCHDCGVPANGSSVLVDYNAGGSHKRPHTQIVTGHRRVPTPASWNNSFFGRMSGRRWVVLLQLDDGTERPTWDCLPFVTSVFVEPV